MTQTLTQFQLLDVVALTEALPQNNLLCGQVGTIVETLAPDVYEVEFSDDDGQAYAMLPLHSQQLLRLHYLPITSQESMPQIHQHGQGDNIAGDKVMGDKIGTQNNFSQTNHGGTNFQTQVNGGTVNQAGIINQTTNNLKGASIGNFANSLHDHAQQISGATTADLIQLITTLRDQAQPFPEAQREDILIELEDLEEQANKPAEQRSLPRIKKRLLAILTAATVAGGAVATTTDFANNITDLGQKFGIAPTELQLPPAK